VPAATPLRTLSSSSETCGLRNRWFSAWGKSPMNLLNSSLIFKVMPPCGSKPLIAGKSFRSISAWWSPSPRTRDARNLQASGQDQTVICFFAWSSALPAARKSALVRMLVNMSRLFIEGRILGPCQAKENRNSISLERGEAAGGSRRTPMRRLMHPPDALDQENTGRDIFWGPLKSENGVTFRIVIQCIKKDLESRATD
jgi:hypothetical protein